MADQDRAASTDLNFKDHLRDAPFKFDFFAAIRRLALLHPELQPVGKSVRPEDDPVLLSQEPFLKFAPASLSKFIPADQNDPDGTELLDRLVIYCLGLFGPDGPLPLHITEFVLDRLQHHHDPTLARFVDLLQHRILTLFYRAWAEAQPTVQHDRPESDRFADYVGSLFGIGTRSFHDRDHVPDGTKRYYSGILSCQTRNPDGLAAMLNGFFFPHSVKQAEPPSIKVQEFVFHWMEIPDSCLTQLRGRRENGLLGQGATLGRRVLDAQSKFRLVIGPLSYDEFQQFLPGGRSLPKLIDFVRNYVGEELDWDIQLVLKKEERPQLQLGKSSALRRNSWLGAQPPNHDLTELTFHPTGTAGLCASHDGFRIG